MKPAAWTLSSETPEVSIVIPRLDEADTVATCVRKALVGLRSCGASGEVIVADNGSRDGSQTLAAEAGAIVVPVARRGYGAALQRGIAAARGEFVIMGDADDSNDFTQVPRFVEPLRYGAALVQDCRFFRAETQVHVAAARGSVSACIPGTAAGRRVDRLRLPGGVAAAAPRPCRHAGGLCPRRRCRDHALLGFSDIVGITLQHQSLEPGWCERLGQLQQLARLDLSGCRFPAADAQVLAELPRLKTLLLARTAIGDDAVRAIPATAHLEALDLSRTRISATAWPLIRRHPLTSLKLDDIAVDAKMAQEILSLPDLQGLSLAGTGINDAVVGAWPADSRLEWLSVSRTKISDASLAWIGRQRRMKYLELADTPITDEGLSALSTLRHLEWVDLSDTDITPAGLSTLHPASLTALDLSGTKLTDDCVEWLQKCRRLTWVDLRNTKVSESVIAELQGDLPDLRIEK